MGVNDGESGGDTMANGSIGCGWGLTGAADNGSWVGDGIGNRAGCVTSTGGPGDVGRDGVSPTGLVISILVVAISIPPADEDSIT